MDEIRSWWEVPCIAHFCHIFAKPFKLVDFEIEELEDTLLLDEMKDDQTPSLLVNLFCGLLNGIVDKEVNEENWEFFLKMHLQWRTDHLGEEWNPHRDKIYKDLDTRTKVEILHKMIHWRMELDDIGELLRGLDGPTLRIDPLGKDESGNVYWYFYGTRLYLETAKKKPPRKTKPDQTPNKGKKGKGAARGKASSPVPEEEIEEGGVWKMVCSTVAEWEELVEDLSNCRRGEGKKLYNYLNNELLPHILYSLQQKEKMFKKKMLAELPRRTSNRLAQKAEEEMMCALAREQQREEFRKMEAEEKAIKEAEAEKRHNEKIEEVMRHRKAKEEEQAKLRQEEEKNWSLAMSGELSGPRQAALGAVQGVVETQTLIEDTFKDEVLHTAMFKVLCGLRRHEDGWVFEEPVSEDIAPGYFDVVSKPMDFQTIEKKIENHDYSTKTEFVSDVQLIFENCKAYNGEDSEYFALSNEMKELFEKLLTEEFVEDMLNKVDEEEEAGGKRGRKKNSPSPELTSESSEESEEEEEDDDDDDEIDNVKKTKKKSMKLHRMEGGLPPPQMMMRPGSGMPLPRMYGPHHHHMMQPGMRPLPPEMMMGGYPPQYPPYPPFPPHMQMRPPRDMYYPPPPDGGYSRYPYPTNGAPPPYRPHMFPPDYPMAPPMGRPMSHPGGPPLPPQLPNGPQPTDQKNGGDKVKRVSSPRVSSTVQTPPTSGDEHVDEDGRVIQEDSNKQEEQKDKTNETSSSETKEQNKTEPKPHTVTATPSQPPPNYPQAQPYNQTHPPAYPGWAPRPGMMRGEYPPPHMMNERYRQAMMAAAHQRMSGYPPPDHPAAAAMWNGQRSPYPSPSGYNPQHQQMIMMERQRRAYYEYQMKMRMRGPPTDQQHAPGSQPSNDKRPLPDYHDSLTRYAMGLAKEEETSSNNDSNKDSATKENGPPKENDANESQENKESNEKQTDKNEKSNDKSNNQSKDQPTKPDKPVQQATPPPPHPSWPHPSQYHQMMSNGYGMPPQMPHPSYHHSPNMYGRPPPHPSQMQYPPYSDPSLYGGNGPHGYSPADMERWHYMEMQRHQWMMQQRNLQLAKRPRSHEDQRPESHSSQVNQKTESHDSHMTKDESSDIGEPPSKQSRNENSKECEQVNGLTEETAS